MTEPMMPIHDAGQMPQHGIVDPVMPLTGEDVEPEEPEIADPVMPVLEADGEPEPAQQQAKAASKAKAKLES